MRIYTRYRRRGRHQPALGRARAKNALRVEVYGTVDEANAHVGMAVALMEGAAFDAVRAVLLRIQNELFYVGADLATPPGRDRGEQPRITQASVAALEADIDRLEAALPPLNHFVLPGGSAPAAALHVARTVVRRAERQLVSLMQQEPVDPALLRYLNRLSDLLFVAARAANQAAGHGRRARGLEPLVRRFQPAGLPRPGPRSQQFRHEGRRPALPPLVGAGHADPQLLAGAGDRDVHQPALLLHVGV